jgi:CO/xanthine dehydrogenase Mo-binding subunit
VLNIERMADQAARDLGIDRLEIRRKNFIRPDQFPYKTATGVEYDSGDYEKSLDRLLEHVDMDAFRREQEELRAQGIYRGIGFSTYTEICGLAPSRVVGPEGFGNQAGFWESALIRVHNTGSVTVYTGASPHGQGEETAFAQIAADRPEHGRCGLRRHRQRAGRAQHVWIPHACGRGRGAGALRREDRREGEGDRCPQPRGGAGGH